ncbi:MAG: 30S ribosomal protein S6 [Vulcanibacillus sp.]
MRKYEVMYIIRTDIEQDAIKALVEKFQKLIIDNGGEIQKLTEMGKKRLAYEIDDHKEGYYVLVKFNSEPNVVAELDRVFRITENVLRYLILKDEK